MNVTLSTAVPDGLSLPDHPIQVFLASMLTDEESGQRSLLELLDNLLVTCIEGGSNYWCQQILLKGERPIPEAHGEEAGCPWYSVAFRAGALPLQVCPEDDATIALTLDAALNGLRLLVEGNHCNATIRQDLLDNKAAADADTADAWLQLAVFGDLVYG